MSYKVEEVPIFRYTDDSFHRGEHLNCSKMGTYGYCHKTPPSNRDPTDPNPMLRRSQPRPVFEKALQGTLLRLFPLWRLNWLMRVTLIMITQRIIISLAFSYRYSFSLHSFCSLHQKNKPLFRFSKAACVCVRRENQAKKREGRMLCRRRTRPLAKTAVITMVIPSPSFFFYTRIVAQNVKKVNT